MPPPPDSGGYLADQFGGSSILVFVAVEIELPASGFLRLIDGSGQVTFGGRTFLGLDPTFGVLAALEPVSDGFGATAPSLRITINPPTASAAAILAGEDMQGGSVYIWFGVISGGVVVPSPTLVFVGEVDQGVLSVGVGSRSLGLDCVSIWELLFDDAQGVRLSNAYHQSAWPGETGFEFVTAITRQLPWGADTPRPQVVADALTVKL